MLHSPFLPNPQPRQPRRDLDRLQADADHLADEAQDVLRVVGAVGVVDDAAAFVGFDAVLVDHPFEDGAVAEAVGEGGGNSAGLSVAAGTLSTLSARHKGTNGDCTTFLYFAWPRTPRQTSPF